MRTTRNLPIILTAAATELLLPRFALAADASACNGAKAVGAPCTGGGFTGQLGTIINAVFVIVGIIAVLVMLYGAVRYITSTGDAKRIQAAKDTIIYALAGLIVAILARAIVGFVIARFG
jgi:drug/metabolite transporter (DMT)-like permease